MKVKTEIKERVNRVIENRKSRKRKLINLKYLTIILSIVFIYSCQKEDDNLYIDTTNTDLNQAEGLIKLGKQLDNPYSIKNMQKALNSLKKSGLQAKATTEQLQIETTHLYIKFVPKNEEELAILKRDSTLVLYDYPLDYEIVENGSFYREESLPEEQPNYQYCAVKVGKELPEGVENEILEELFIPDEDNDELAKSNNTLF